MIHVYSDFRRRQYRYALFSAKPVDPVANGDAVGVYLFSPTGREILRMRGPSNQQGEFYLLATDQPSNEFLRDLGDLTDRVSPEDACNLIFTLIDPAARVKELEQEKTPPAPVPAADKTQDDDSERSRVRRILRRMRRGAGAVMQLRRASIWFRWSLIGLLVFVVGAATGTFWVAPRWNAGPTARNLAGRPPTLNQSPAQPAAPEDALVEGAAILFKEWEVTGASARDAWWRLATTHTSYNPAGMRERFAVGAAKAAVFKEWLPADSKEPDMYGWVNETTRQMKKHQRDVDLNLRKMVAAVLCDPRPADSRLSDTERDGLRTATGLECVQAKLTAQLVKDGLTAVRALRTGGGAQ